MVDTHHLSIYLTKHNIPLSITTVKDMLSSATDTQIAEMRLEGVTMISTTLRDNEVIMVPMAWLCLERALNLPANVGQPS